jgi:hypothetical protein
MVSRDRFELALEGLKSSDWERFERLCSEFLVTEYPQLRTMASSSGDGGRDAELWSPVPRVVLQYSIRTDWETKIKQTIKRIKETKPQAAVLIYASNQRIGALADPIRAYTGDQGLFLDIRDRGWFADRLHLNSANENAAEELSKAIVDPLLASKGIVVGDRAKLTGNEARTALFYLEMQWRDENAAKGLTRSCYEALVKVALRDTDSDHRIKRAEIYDRVQQLLPHYSIGQLKPFIDAAIARLTKVAVRHWPKLDEFNLSFEELQRIGDKAASIELLRGDFKQEIIDYINTATGVSVEKIEELAESIIDVIEKYFLKRGEEFAAYVARDVVPPINEPDIESILVGNLPGNLKIRGREPIGFLQSLIASILNNPSPATAEYVNVLSDAYTLFAFLAETPDVQSVTKKLFSHGEIWLDASVLLPIFAEQAYPEGLRPFTNMYINARKSGLTLLVTPGIIEEIERHLNRCVVYDRKTDWEGRVPYVYTKYALAGKPAGGFRGWAEQFFGNLNPTQDIADYLTDEFGIQVVKIDPDNFKKLPVDLVREITGYWEAVQNNRRGEDSDILTTMRLAQHDVENYLNALLERQGVSTQSSLGFKTWWLTLDRAARLLPSKIDSDLARLIRFQPTMSVNFLIKYMTFGPSRDRLNSTAQTTRVFSSAVFDNLPPNLLSVAREVREKSGQLPERIVQRRIRDSLDQQKSALGAVDKVDLESAESAILGEL